MEKVYKISLACQECGNKYPCWLTVFNDTKEYVSPECPFGSVNKKAKFLEIDQIREVEL